MKLPSKIRFVDEKLKESFEKLEKEEPTTFKILNQAFKNTIAWFANLVQLADDDWAQTRQYKTISDLQRKACKYLNLTRDWNFDIFTSQNNSCWACKESIHPDALVCSKCNAILNASEYAKRKDSFAKV